MQKDVCRRKKTSRFASASKSSSSSASSEEKLLPNQQKNKKMLFDDDLLVVPIKSVVYCCCGLPFGAFITCIILSLILHSDGATKTHCGVDNYLPSISAAIGDYTPERYVWRICIALHAAPRFAVALVYKNFYLTSPLRPLHSIENGQFWYRALCWGVCLLHLAENFALLCLTYVSSTENHGFHQWAFIAFMICSICYMMSTLYVFNYSGRRRSSTLGEKSYQYKLLFFCACLSSFLVSLYFFWRHNVYCEGGIYTVFAGSEYLVVLTNILFHGTAKLDFFDRKVTLTSGGGASEWHVVTEAPEVSVEDKNI